MADKMTLQQTLSFFRSVIQSGEPWTEACESAYSAAMAHLAGMGEPVAGAAGLESTLKGWIDTKAWLPGESAQEPKSNG